MENNILFPRRKQQEIHRAVIVFVHRYTLGAPIHSEWHEDDGTILQICHILNIKILARNKHFINKVLCELNDNLTHGTQFNITSPYRLNSGRKTIIKNGSDEEGIIAD